MNRTLRKGKEFFCSLHIFREAEKFFCCFLSSPPSSRFFHLWFLIIIPLFFPSFSSLPIRESPPQAWHHSRPNELQEGFFPLLSSPPPPSPPYSSWTCGQNKRWHWVIVLPLPITGFWERIKLISYIDSLLGAGLDSCHATRWHQVQCPSNVFLQWLPMQWQQKDLTGSGAVQRQHSHHI